MSVREAARTCEKLTNRVRRATPHLPLPRAPGELRYLLIGDAGIGVPAHGEAMMMMDLLAHRLKKQNFQKIWTVD